MNKKILFLHGFFASGQCVLAQTLRESFEGRAEVFTPDLPMHPKEAMCFIRELIDREKPDLWWETVVVRFTLRCLLLLEEYLLCLEIHTSK